MRGDPSGGARQLLEKAFLVSEGFKHYSAIKFTASVSAFTDVFGLSEEEQRSLALFKIVDSLGSSIELFEKMQVLPCI